MSKVNLSNPISTIIKNLLIIIEGIKSIKELLLEIKKSIKPVERKKWLTAKELYKILPIKARTLTKYRAEGKITFSRFQGLWLYDYEEILNEIENNIHPKK
ncbi:MAG: helix-turn-helix domain-containing protein [Marinifilaceae bacterium]